MVKAMNKFALSMINYYVGIVNFEPEDFKKIDDQIRLILIHNNIHLQPSNKERLYLPRDELGRGLACLEHRSELMLYKLNKQFQNTKHVILRRAAILKIQEQEKTHFWVITKYLCNKYNLVENELTDEQVILAQKNRLYDNINEKNLHKKLYSIKSQEIISLQDSSVWLKKGNIPASREGSLCSLQDRNIFLGERGMCPHCNASKKSVDHLASKCEKMLGSDYTRRHNEVLKCIHLLMCNKFGLKSKKKLRNHTVAEVVANKFAEIRVDTTVKTDIKIKHNRPDLIVIDKKKKEILIVEVGITSIDNLQQVETEKLRKYDLLANELTQLHGFKTVIVPYVLTWDGVVTTFHDAHRRRIGISSRIEAYIQSLVLKKTLESISFSYRREGDIESEGTSPEKESKILQPAVDSFVQAEIRI